jgi:hypothetical protein
MDIRIVVEADGSLLVRHYLAVWDSYGTPREHLYPDAEERVRAFLDEGRRERKLKAFIAVGRKEASRPGRSRASCISLPIRRW